MLVHELLTGHDSYSNLTWCHKSKGRFITEPPKVVEFRKSHCNALHPGVTTQKIEFFWNWWYRCAVELWRMRLYAQYTDCACQPECYKDTL